MASGRIQNRTILQRVADFLNLEGVKRFPAVLDTTDIKAVIDIGRFENLATPNGGQGAVYAIGDVDVDVGGNAEYVGEVIGDVGGGGLQGGPGVSWRVDHLDLEIEFNAAGRTAMVDKQMFLYVEIFDTGGDPGPRNRPINLANWFYGILNGPLRYPWTLYGWSQGAVANFGSWGSHSWHGVVPAVDSSEFLSEFWGLRIVIGRVDGAAMPAGTTVTWAARVRKSDNATPPLGY
jgi:hypothetical protein